MDYSKFLYSKNKINFFKLKINNDYIKNSMNILIDIDKANYVLKNYYRFDFKIDIDEYFAYFLKEKNEFIKEFSNYININIKLFNNEKLKSYNNILSLIKNNLDDLLIEFKILKQNLYKKLRKQELFNKMKYDYFNNLDDKGNIDYEKDKIKKDNIKYINTDLYENENNMKPFQESNNLINVFMKNANKNYEKTKQILYELSDLMTTVQKKMYEQSKITKFIISNSINSIENIDKGNEHLKKAQEYQKGRGLSVGIIFIILGIFLLLYDAIL